MGSERESNEVHVFGAAVFNSIDQLSYTLASMTSVLRCTWIAWSRSHFAPVNKEQIVIVTIQIFCQEKKILISFHSEIQCSMFTNLLSFESMATETCPNCNRVWWFSPDDSDWNMNWKDLICSMSRPRELVGDRLDFCACTNRIWCHRRDTFVRKSTCTGQYSLGSAPVCYPIAVQEQAAVHKLAKYALQISGVNILIFGFKQAIK